MMRKVAIVGVAQTRFERQKKGEGFPDLVFDVSRRALEDAGISANELHQTITASQDFYDGRTISNFAVSDACASFMKPESKVAMDSSMAVFYSLARILSGSYDNGLVVTHCKMSQGQPNLIYNAVFDPIYQRHLGLDAHSVHAFQARAYMNKYGITAEQCAAVSVKNHANALKNPYAQEGCELTIREVLSSPMLADPLHTLDAMPVSDGACALVLAEESTAKRLTKKPVWIKGIASFMDAYYLGERDLADPSALTKAAQKAYAMAGIQNPAKEIDVAEVTEYYSYQELLWAEGLGLCGRGKGGRMVEDGTSSLTGSLPINPSGGVLAGNPYTVAGLVRVVEAYLQLTSAAGEHQIEGARTAVAHGTTGPCGQSHCVIVLSTQ
jgi:acetyl-CoA C-acetyltransferase